MEMKLPLSLAFFTTTKGHYDRKDIYRRTISDLFEKLEGDCFSVKIAHIKLSEGEEAVAKEMSGFFSEWGIESIITEGKWKHNDSSHYVEHAKDICKLFSSPQIQSQPFVFWLEDDFVFKLSKDKNLLNYFKEALAFLSSNPDLVCFRFLRHASDVERISAVKTGFDHILVSPKEFSFNPNLCRTRDLYWAARIMEREFSRSGTHIETFFRMIMQSGSKTGDIACFHPDYVCVKHIGTPIGEEEI